MLDRLQFEHPIESLAAVVSADEVIACQQAVRAVPVDEKIRDYVVRIIRGTRTHPAVGLGASPRAAMALFRAAQSLAAINGADFVFPDHVKQVAATTLAHRLIIKPESRLRKATGASVLAQVIEQAAVPTIPGGGAG